MVVRRERTRVVLDTNVLVRNLKSRSSTSSSRIVVAMWLRTNRLPLIVSPELIEEYPEAFERVVGLSPPRLASWRQRFEQDSRCTRVELGRRFTGSRDADDNVFLSAAYAGRAEYLITHDRDLLELSESFRRTLPFEILTPAEFLNIAAAQ